MSRARAHAAAALLFLVGAWLRFAQLGRLPSPAGDEGTWTLLALRLSRGERAGLPPDAAFVSKLFAWLIAGSFQLFGASFGAARAVCAVASLGAAAAAYFAIGRLGSRHGALAAAAVLALHPWAIAWGRTASVPYALALFTATAGPLAFQLGLRERRDAWLAAGVLLAGLGAQFTPLALVSALACAALLVPRDARWVLRRPLVWAAAALVALVTAPLVRAALVAARVSPALGPSPPLGPSLITFAHAVLTGLAGEATVRHFTGAALAPRAAWLLTVPVLAVVALASRGGVLRRAGLAELAIALVVVPLLLAGARAWQLATIDADRYLVAWLPGLACCAADVASTAGRRAKVAIASLLAVLGAADARAALWTTRSGGPDTGLLVFDGGGAYRGWRASRAGDAVANVVARAIVADARGEPCVVLITDWAFHPLRFALDGSGARVRDVRSHAPRHAEPARTYAVLWSDAVFASATTPRFAADENAALRAQLGRCFLGATPVARLAQPDGRGLLEVWRAQGLDERARGGLGCATAP